MIPKSTLYLNYAALAVLCVGLVASMFGTAAAYGIALVVFLVLVVLAQHLWRRSDTKMNEMTPKGTVLLQNAGFVLLGVEIVFNFFPGWEVACTIAGFLAAVLLIVGGVLFHRFNKQKS